MYEYKTIYLDLEWWHNVHTGEDELLSLAAVSENENNGCMRTYFRYIRPDDYYKISEKLLWTIGSSYHNIEYGHSQEEALNNFFYTYKDIETMVVWNAYTYSVFCSTTNALGITMKPHKVIVLQDWLKQISDVGTISFSRALEIAGINYDKRLLHIGKHDAMYLKELYDAICKEYQLMADRFGADANLDTHKLLKWSDSFQLQLFKPEYINWNNVEHITSDDIQAMGDKLGIHIDIPEEGCILAHSNAGLWQIHHKGDKVLAVSRGKARLSKQIEDIQNQIKPVENYETSLCKLLNQIRDMANSSKREYVKKRWEMLSEQLDL